MKANLVAAAAKLMGHVAAATPSGATAKKAAASRRQAGYEKRLKEKGFDKVQGHVNSDLRERVLAFVDRHKKKPIAKKKAEKGTKKIAATSEKPCSEPQRVYEFLDDAISGRIDGIDAARLAAEKAELEIECEAVIVEISNLRDSIDESEENFEIERFNMSSVRRSLENANSEQAQQIESLDIQLKSLEDRLLAWEEWAAKAKMTNAALSERNLELEARIRADRFQYHVWNPICDAMLGLAQTARTLRPFVDQVIGAGPCEIPGFMDRAIPEAVAAGGQFIRKAYWLKGDAGEDSCHLLICEDNGEHWIASFPFNEEFKAAAIKRSSYGFLFGIEQVTHGSCLFVAKTSVAPVGDFILWHANFKM